jgi:hypothetical protein
MRLKVKLVVLILIAGLLVSSAIWASEKSPTAQTVVFINSIPGITVLGLVKFIVDEDNKPIGYVILNKRWDEERKVLWLEPGLYGITQYCPKFDRVTGYRNFWVKDKPVLIEI